MLDDEALAYMRATQAEARPTAAEFRRRVQTRTASGGTTNTWSAAEPVDVRLNHAPDEVPDVLAARLEGTTPTQVTMDLATDVRDGDRLTVTPTEVYEFVSDGTPNRWATAQQVWARRVTYPPRVA